MQTTNLISIPFFFLSFNKSLSHASCRSRILILIHKNRNEIRLSLKDFRSNLHLSLLLIRTNDAGTIV